ncbi:MAG: quinolinate synthase NadA [Bacillota bacterium]
MRDEDLIAAIRERKEHLSMVFLAHLYQRPEIQRLADFVGDSLGLSQQAAATGAEIILFCGVHFMAESAAILSPHKRVLLPEPKAGCPMADMVTVGALEELKAKHPGVPVVCYVNTSAAVKAASDICCTSANAVKVVESLGVDTVIFVPDRNLAHYVGRQTGVRIIPWEGFCPTHDKITADDIRAAKRRYPGAEVVVHPECPPAVVDLADKVGSTSGIIRYVTESPAREFIIGTETGILHELERAAPGKRFHFPVPDKQLCPNMKATNLKKVLTALTDLAPQVTVPEDIASRARVCLDRMLAVGR